MSRLIQNKQRVERVRFETDRYMVVGDVTLPADGYQSRLSDALNRDAVFIPLVDAEVTALDGGAVERYPFMIVSKSHVRAAYPVESGSEPT